MSRTVLRVHVVAIVVMWTDWLTQTLSIVHVLCYTGQGRTNILYNIYTLVSVCVRSPAQVLQQVRPV